MQLLKDFGRISVVIPTKNRPLEIIKCIDSILKQTVPVDEIIVVDSSENRNLQPLLRKNFSCFTSKIKYIYSDVSNNAARNMGVQQSTGEIVFFFDDDVVLEMNYVREVMKIFEHDKEGKVAGVMGDIINLKRNIRDWRATLRRLFFLDYFGNGKFRLSGLPTWVHGERQVKKTEFLSGCMMAFRKHVFMEFKFDENLGKMGGYCYLDDVDLSYRVSRKHELVYTPFAKLKHTGPTKISSAKKRQYVFNHFYLFKKNVPKNLTNILAFFVSIFGLLISTGIFERDVYGFLALLKGLRDVTAVSWD